MTSVKLINHSSSTADWNEYEEVEIIHCPQIQDTIQIPDWEPEE